MRHRAKKHEIVRIRDKLEDLPVEQRVAVVAHYYDGLKISEIAGLLDCSESMVKSYLHHAGATLKIGMDYKLRFLTPMVLYVASEALLDSKAYTMPETEASLLYSSIYSRLGLN